eukprot:269326_1
MAANASLSNRTSIFLCISLFLYGSANACYYAFLSIWLSFHHFTYTQIGYIRGLNQGSVLLFVPVLCLVTDQISSNNPLKRRFLFSIFCLTVASSRLLFIYWQHSWNPIFCALIVITVAVQEATNSIMDSIVLAIIPNPNRYGRYRMWAGLGWSIVAVSLGLLFEFYFSIDTMFYFFTSFMGCLGLIWLMPTIKDILCGRAGAYSSSLLINVTEAEVIQMGFYRKLWMFWRQMNLFKFQIIFSFFVLGASFGVINTFMFLRLQEMNASTVLMGVTYVVTLCSEFPAFLLVEHALHSIGDLGIICVGLFAYMLRLSWYGLLGFHGILNSPWYVLPAELLHGLTFAWIKASVCVFAHRLANNEHMSIGNVKIDLSSFSQGFLSAIFNGFGQGFGGIIGGIVFDLYGPHYLFFGNALVLLPLLMIYVFQFACCRKRLSVNQTDRAQIVHPE